MPFMVFQKKKKKGKKKKKNSNCIIFAYLLRDISRCGRHGINSLKVTTTFC